MGTNEALRQVILHTWNEWQKRKEEIRREYLEALRQANEQYRRDMEGIRRLEEALKSDDQ